MSKPIILAEKPSQAKAYASAFTIKDRTKTHIEIKPCEIFKDGAIITWAIGHLIELQSPSDYDEKYKRWSLSNLPIVPPNFIYKVSADKKSHYAEVAKMLKSTDTIIIGTDIDREGEAIARLIINHAKADNKTIKRLWINSLEEDEIRKGFANLKDGKDTYNLFIEAQSRQMADWIIGMNFSPLYTLLLQKKGFEGSLSVGRVQTPTVYLIYQRQKEIENFVPKKFYEIEGNFTAANGSYKGKAKIKSDKKEEVQELLLKNGIGEKNEAIVKSVSKKEKRTKSPKLHALSTLQATANKNWRYSPADVLKLVQGLYEKKLVSYPRTDTQVITDSEFTYLLNNVTSLQKLAKTSFDVASTEPNKRYVDGKNVAEHYAIIPTKNIPSESTINGLTEQERNLYFEILHTTLAMFHSDYVYEETKILTGVNELEFETTGNTEKSLGWKELFKNTSQSADEDKKEITQALPVLENNERVLAVVKLKEGVTTPPKPYTEGQLIGMMKTCGKSVEDTEDMEILKEVEGLGTEATRSNIIEAIKRQEYIDVKKNIVHVTKKGEILCESVEGTLLASPSMTAKWELYLKKIGEGKASQQQFVKQTTSFVEKMIQDVPGKLSVESISTAIKESKEKDYLCKCPACQKGHIVEKKNNFSCTESCNFSLPKTLLKKKISVTAIKSLCEKGKTAKIKGFESKAGKKFDAVLELDEQKKIKFSFN
ncbi:DNA topoisomerase 3 [Planococcus kocurii]|uniref:type IA DNA topoisomerase n=1 Tax=Planococcus kocurii TaxID=1374 RepID=UPI003D04ED11